MYEHVEAPAHGTSVTRIDLITSSATKSGKMTGVAAAIKHTASEERRQTLKYTHSSLNSSPQET